MCFIKRIQIANDSTESMKVACGSCDGETLHTVLTSVETVEEPGKDIVFNHNYKIIQCKGCETISFYEIYKSDPPDDEVGEVLNVYPSRVTGKPLKAWFFDLPPGVFHCYREVHKALCDENYILAGMGIRALVESVCVEKKASGNRLQGMIESLVEQDVITQGNARTLHNLRFMGNDAAHQLRTHSARELSAAFEIVENLLESVYVIPETAKRLPKKGKGQR